MRCTLRVPTTFRVLLIKLSFDIVFVAPEPQCILRERLQDIKVTGYLMFSWSGAMMLRNIPKCDCFVQE